MLIKNETRTEIEKKKLSKVATSSGNNRQILAFFWFIFYEGTYRKNTLKILSSNFCVDAAKNGAQYWTALPCMLCMQSMDPTAGFVVVHKLLFSCFFIFIFFLLVYLLFFVFFCSFALGLPFLVCMRQGWFVLKRIRQSWNLYILFPAVWLTFSHLAP